MEAFYSKFDNSFYIFHRGGGESPCAFVALKHRVDKSDEQHLEDGRMKFCYLLIGFQNRWGLKKGIGRLITQ